MASKKVLLIEDDTDIRNTLREILVLEDYDVVTGGNGREGLDLLMKDPSIRIVLLDMMMPVMNGWEFLTEMRANSAWASIPVIAISAAGFRASAVNADVYLRKPLDLDLLLDTIRRFCD